MGIHHKLFVVGMVMPNITNSWGFDDFIVVHRGCNNKLLARGCDDIIDINR